MREHVSQDKKTTTGFSIPSLKNPTRGFASESSIISCQAVPEIQPLTHDISSIPLRSQAKLSISQPGDIYEQEVDSVAQQVMQRMAQPVNRQSIQQEVLPEKEELQMKPLANSITPLVQRQQMPEDEEKLQMKSLDNSTLQRQEMPEGDEELQRSPTVQRQTGITAIQKVADKIVQRVFDFHTPATYDDDGGHSYADHGSQTTPANHLTRLTTGSTPSGRTSLPPDGKSSKFASDAMHLAAMTMAINDLNANKKNRAGGWKKGYSNHYTLAGVGETYELDASGNNLQPTTLPCNRFFVAWGNDGTGDNFKLITMYPKP